MKKQTQTRSEMHVIEIQGSGTASIDQVQQIMDMVAPKIVGLPAPCCDQIVEGLWTHHAGFVLAYWLGLEGAIRSAVAVARSAAN